jgi:large subunit ribosomal protein L4
MNAKERRAALRSVLTAKAGEDAVRVVEGFDLDKIGTRAMAERLAGWEADGKVLLVLAGRDEVVERSCRNLQAVRVILADSLNVVDLLEADTVVFTRDALERAQEVYA